MRVKKTWLIAGALVATAAAWRVINWEYQIAPNLELVTASALVAAVFLGWRWALGVAVATMAVADIIIGNTSILFFTWSAFALIAVGGLLLKRLKHSPKSLVLGALGAAVASSVFFFVFTNFGVWLTTDMYPKTWAGLMQSYYMGLPFYRTMLLGNLVIVPAYFAVALYAPVLLRQVRKAPAKAEA
jgi:hypothetical protein